ncbi:alternative ribosome rescue aminoacyl-tRNA hydrolase ArfB [Alteromonas halophila]|uniref:Aminoacyl-tRNA hydrolase n=1 Tax=Alteromonas halophila TaxID=516698 RepID=A0A918JFE0_9ALTE|nr:alternative ribosome rescue aminoacyl-tRNA hydrolase ArfB [Alteromonas halophila]GGW78061.1 aminoacyl-tRNA hydrolase [Alteromonas halophila]
MITITRSVHIADAEVEMHAVRAQGAGGQNVNKVNSAIHLRFDVHASSLPEHLKERLLARQDNRLTDDGTFVLKAQRFRTQEQNRIDAIERLQAWLAGATRTQKKRKPTRVPKGARRRRKEAKKKQSQTKALRKKVDF